MPEVFLQVLEKMRSCVFLLILFACGAWAQDAFLEASTARGSAFRRTEGALSSKDVPLAQALEIDNWGEYEMVRSLLPSRFSLTNGKRLQAKIDHATERIFESSTARKSLCFLAAGKPSDLVAFFGVSKSSAARLQTHCRDQKLGPAQKQGLEHLRALYNLDGGTLSWEKPKRYALIFPQNEAARVSSYTTRENLTLLFVPRPGMSEPELIRFIAHEIAITFDQMNTLAPPHEHREWEGHWLPQVFGAKRGVPVFKTPPDIQALRCALRDPALRYSAMIERASRFEDQVIRDLGLESASPAVAANASCRASLVHWASVQPAVGAPLRWEQENQDPACGRPQDDRDRATTFLQRLDLVNGTVLRFTDSKKTLPLCQLLLETRLGDRMPDLYRGGPRPRIGGWKELRIPGAPPELTPGKIEKDLGLLARQKALAEKDLEKLNEALRLSNSWQDLHSQAATTEEPR